MGGHRRGNEAVTILHLTDVHAGDEALVDEDLNVKIAPAERRKQLDRLTGYIEALPTVPDYVVA